MRPQLPLAAAGAATSQYVIQLHACAMVGRARACYFTVAIPQPAYVSSCVHHAFMAIRAARRTLDAVVQGTSRLGPRRMREASTRSDKWPKAADVKLQSPSCRALPGNTGQQLDDVGCGHQALLCGASSAPSRCPCRISLPLCSNEALSTYSGPRPRAVCCPPAGRGHVRSHPSPLLEPPPPQTSGMQRSPRSCVSGAARR